MTNVHKRILVAISTSSQTQRLKLEGILKYAHERHGDSWRIQLDLGGFVRQQLMRFKKRYRKTPLEYRKAMSPDS